MFGYLVILVFWYLVFLVCTAEDIRPGADGELNKKLLTQFVPADKKLSLFHRRQFHHGEKNKKLSLFHLAILALKKLYHGKKTRNCLVFIRRQFVLFSISNFAVKRRTKFSSFLGLPILPWKKIVPLSFNANLHEKKMKGCLLEYQQQLFSSRFSCNVLPFPTRSRSLIRPDNTVSHHQISANTG